ncbi:MAG: hypothetical protein ACE5JN_10055 [Candidatus Methylomirabilia bacterium]
MNALSHLLTADVCGSVERIAATSEEGTVGFVAAYHPALRARVEDAETRLAALRADLLDRYTIWEQTLMEIEMLWALAGWEAKQPGAAEALRTAA